MLRILKLVRAYSTSPDTENVEKCRQFLKQLARHTIPKNSYKLAFSRSSGSGGQNVNKVSTKATLTLSEEFIYRYLPKEVYLQLKAKNYRYFNKLGLEIVIQSDLTRLREQNIDDCFKKLVSLIRENVYFRNTENDAENKQKWEKIKKRTNEERIRQKKMVSQKKRDRGRIFDW